jgi:hypothetical protein
MQIRYSVGGLRLNRRAAPPLSAESGSTSAGPKCRTRVNPSAVPNGFPVT